MADLQDVMDLDDDDVDDDAHGLEYKWFQRPAPSFRFTFVLAGILLILTSIHLHRRVQRVKHKFGGRANSDFRGLLRFCSMVSAYMDNDEPTFAIARLFTKALVFLGLLQIGYHRGFLLMLCLLVLESSLDTARILLANWSCRSLRQLRVTSAEEAKEIRETATQLEPTNVYEDLTRPRSIAVMVFLVQSLLIGIVLFDSYSTTTRTCFNGTDGCQMLASLGSYCLYFLGTFMACVFYVGPMNSYGKKEHNAVFWLKLFLMSKDTRSVLSWKDPVTDQTKMMHLRQNDWRIWFRFFMSLIINSVCFHFLLHVLPIQIASKSSIMGVVFSSVGMIYLVDLDDTSGSTMTLVPHRGERVESGTGSANGYDSTGISSERTDFEAVKQGILDEAMKDIRAKLEVALADGSTPHHKTIRIDGITHALFLSSQKNDEEASHPKQSNEETPLV